MRRVFVTLLLLFLDGACTIKNIYEWDRCKAEDEAAPEG
ncbi:hypothetical protein MNBD_ALPHA05-1170 [hydrothermal vent metagenome]|uniref:Uncharacterized protein n=1 Tax=hydrothermal vent metagenome TaxID=652676 RepID=A0A3B0S918_9ZZZZ